MAFGGKPLGLPAPATPPVPLSEPTPRDPKVSYFTLYRPENFTVPLREMVRCGSQSGLTPGRGFGPTNLGYFAGAQGKGKRRVRKPHAG